MSLAPCPHMPSLPRAASSIIPELAGVQLQGVRDRGWSAATGRITIERVVVGEEPSAPAASKSGVGVNAKDTLMQFAIFGSAQADSERPGAALGEGFHEFVEFNVEAEALGYYASFLVRAHRPVPGGCRGVRPPLRSHAAAEAKGVAVECDRTVDVRYVDHHVVDLAEHDVPPPSKSTNDIKSIAPIEIPANGETGGVSGSG